MAFLSSRLLSRSSLAACRKADSILATALATKGRRFVKARPKLLKSSTPTASSRAHCVPVSQRATEGIARESASASSGMAVGVSRAPASSSS